ncbi:protein Wiz [Gouania willdenowi]|uniref:protein Wiz n=1 Tax=Gouania willdenowi TaxID=441366 RepID=UPI001055E447|nr:protein Wiz-like [Gouania willdenowi]
MEPEERSQTPGTSDGPPSLNSAQNPDSDAHLQSSCTPSVRDGPMSAKSSRSHAGDESEGLAAEPGRGAQRRVKSSAFPSSLSLDSDSERETPDEEELQRFSNADVLAAHSPGSPSAELRQDSKNSEEAEQQISNAASTFVEERDDSKESTKSDKSTADLSGQTELPDEKVCKVKPKEDCQMEEGLEDNVEEEEKPKGEEILEPERDVYTFPGDSDPDSPPPASWARCTFIQRCGGKQVLLKPFSGLGTRKHTSHESTTQAELKAADMEQSMEGEGLYDFEEVDYEEAEEIKFSNGDEERGLGNQIFTCVECSIYFKKQIHLQEHMVEHCQVGAERGGALGKDSRFRCLECGCGLPHQPALEDHQKRHQESRQRILKEIEKLNENSAGVQTLDKVSDPDIVQSPPLSPDIDRTVFEVDSSPPNVVHDLAQGRTVSASRRRFVCTKCNFSTRTPQALANHSKTHNRRKPSLQTDPPTSPPSLASTSLACGHCAFVTSSKAILREHQVLVHSGRTRSNQSGQHRSNVAARTSPLDSEHLSETRASLDAAKGKRQRGITACEGSDTRDGLTSPPANQGIYKFARNRRFTRRGKIWADLTLLDSGLDGERQPVSEDEEEEQQSGARTNKDGSSSPHRATLSLTAQKGLKDKEKEDEEKDAEVVFLRRSARVTAASAQFDSDDDNIDEKRVRRFVTDGLLDEDRDETDDAVKSVERKCPYCPDRFHNGIGLANHVRGHLNRVGVSYNVRHFISAEEVNAIERKFSYQRKKKKVANFDPDTFSVMRCEFCSAGFDTRAGLSSHARAHLRDFGVTNWDVTISPIHILRELFSSRPDLVIPTAPPRSSDSPGAEEYEEDEEESDVEEEEGEGGVDVKLEDERRERSVSNWDALSSAFPRHWENRDGLEECDGDDDDEDEDEDDDEDPQRLSPGKAEGAGVKILKCKVCDAHFETRRGLAHHARSHLRQLGISIGEPVHRQRAKESHAGRKRGSPPSDPPPIRTPSLSPKDEELEDMDVDEKPIPLSLLAKAAKAAPPSSSSALTPSLGVSPDPAHSASPPFVVKKAPISSLLPVSSPLRSLEHKALGLKSLTSSLCAPTSISAGKPLWAPHEDDAPLNLTLEVDPNKDIVCQLCGAWFETRKGLSSHARAHLRHFGVEYSESKGSPIDLLNQLLDTDDFKHTAMQMDFHPDPHRFTSTKRSLLSHSSSSSSSFSSLHYKKTMTLKATSSSSASFGPTAKRHKSSSMQVFRLSSGELMAVPHSEPPKEIGCEFCGEYFENRKGLSSHARSHLRQMGITEWSVNGSPIDTLREIITRRGLPCALPLKPLKTPPPSSPGPPRSPLSTSSSPSSTFASRLPFAFARPSSPPRSPLKSSAAQAMSPSGSILKLKPEPIQVEVTRPESVDKAAESLNSSWGSSDNVFPLNFAVSHEPEPTRDIRCEFCGEYFENRKGLSSHARSHLRQMGITEWSVNGSPIDTLREVMHKRGLEGPSGSDPSVKKESNHGAGGHRWDGTEGSAAFSYQSSKYRKSPLSLLQMGSRFQKQGLGSSSSSPTGKFFRMSPLGKRPPSEEAHTADGEPSSQHPIKSFSSFSQDFSLKKKPSPDKHRHQDPSCELCGFYFENRKALASHARAHLRQFGVTEWCVNGSPIETLSAWIRSRPQKVLEMHRSYMQGSRSALKKKSSSPLTASAEPDHCLSVSAQKAPSSSSSSSSSHWSSSLTPSLGRPQSGEVKPGSSKNADGDTGSSSQASSGKAGRSSPGFTWLGGGGFPLQAQVARSELNVRLPRGFERRPVKHPSCSDGSERDSGPPKAPRTGTVPALVPKPPSYPLVKLVGKFYTLKCRFCEVEFHGPLSVQEDWIRHLQQHILQINYDKPDAPKAGNAHQCTVQGSASTSTPTLASSPSRRSLTPLSERGVSITARELVLAPESKRTLTPAPIPLPAPTA